MSTPLICLGKITSPHGVRGQVKVMTFTQFPEDIVAYGPLYDNRGEREFRLKIVAQQKDNLIVAIEGVTDRAAAEKLRGVEFYIPKTALPEAEEDEFYHADLIGMKAQLKGGKTFGRVKAVHNYGAGDLLEIIQDSDGKTLFLPFTKESVAEVFLAEGYIVVEIPEEIIAKEQ